MTCDIAPYIYYFFYLTLILLRLFQQHYCYNVTCQSQESEGSCKPARIKEVHSKLHSFQASLSTLTATHLTLIYVCTYIRLSVPLGCLIKQAGIIIHTILNMWETPGIAYKLLFILSKKIVPSRSYRCLKMEVYSGPIYIRFYVSNDTYIWALASALVPSATEIIKSLSETYKLLFNSSKNIVPSRSYRCLKMDVYIRDRAFPVTRLPAPILVRMS